MTDTDPVLQPDWVAPTRTALLLIDMQEDFGGPGGKMAERGMDMTAPQTALDRAAVLLAVARAAGVAVIFVRYLSRPGTETHIAREAKARRDKDEPDLCVDGTPGADFIGPRPLSDDEVVSKFRFSAFTRTGLAEQLHARGLDTLVLCGLTTECCIAASAWEAFERDFHVFVAADACAAYEEDLHQSALKALRLSGATVAVVADYRRAWNTFDKTTA